MSTGLKNLEAQISKHGGTASSRVTEPCIAAEHCMLNTIGLDGGRKKEESTFASVSGSLSSTTRSRI